MKAYFDHNGTLVIQAESNSESMAMRYFSDNNLPIQYWHPSFDIDGNITDGLSGKEVESEMKTPQQSSTL